MQGTEVNRSPPERTWRCRIRPSVKHTHRLAVKAMGVPATFGIVGSLNDSFDGSFDQSVYNDELGWLTSAHPGGVGFRCLDHLTRNVFEGNMHIRPRFYGDLFNFGEIRYFFRQMATAHLVQELADA